VSEMLARCLDANSLLTMSATIAVMFTLPHRISNHLQALLAYIVRVSEKAALSKAKLHCLDNVVVVKRGRPIVLGSRLTQAETLENVQDVDQNGATVNVVDSLVARQKHK